MMQTLRLILLAPAGILSLAVPGALSAQQTPPLSTPRAIVREATRAVEQDEVAAVRARWSRAANAAGAGRPALLGLATLAALAYEFERADSLYAQLAPADESPSDLVSVYARAGRALAARAQGDYQRAAGLLERAVADAHALGDVRAEAELLMALASTRMRTTGPGAAEELLQRAETLAAGDVELEALYHCTRAEVLVFSNRFARAEAEQGANLARQAGNGRLHASCRQLYAADVSRSGNTITAIDTYAEVVAERRRLHDRAGLANALQWRGFLLRGLGQLDEARRDLEDAVTEGRPSRNRAAQAYAFSNLAFVALAVGDLGAGAVYADSAVALFAVQGDRYGQSIVYSVEAELAMAAGDRARARRAYEETVRISEQLGFGGSLVTARVGLAHLAIERADWTSATRELKAARDYANDHNMAGRFVGLSYHVGLLSLHQGRLAQAALEFGASVRRMRHPLDDARMPDQGDWVYLYAMRLAEVNARRGDLSGAEALARAATDALDTWRASLNNQELRLQAFQVAEDRSDPDLGLATVVATLAAAGRVTAAFALTERTHARTLLDRMARLEVLDALDSVARADWRGASAEQVVAAMPDTQTALLEFLTGRGGEPTTVFIVTRAGVRARVLTPVDSLSASIATLNGLLAAGSAPRPLMRALGAALLDSALADLPHAITRLVVVADGDLHRVPFDALLLSDDRFVIERFAVAELPSASVGVRLAQRPPLRAAVRVLAVADPAMPGSGNAVDAVGARAAVVALRTEPRLRGSAREARRVARYGTSSTVLLQRNASARRLRQEALADYRVLHFATHARVDEETASGTALVLAPTDGDDGLVGPAEIARWKLAADLVVLSACRSGGGRTVRGEGVVGLATSFIEAGASSVMLTRWPIGDNSTVAFVGSFYSALAAGQPVADALRSAKIESIGRGAPPAEWAAFTIIGDPMVRVPLSAPRMSLRSYWWVGLAAAGLLAVLVRAWRQRVGGTTNSRSPRPPLL